MSEKSEAPTPRRLRRARAEGDSPISAATVQAVVFLALLPLVPAAARASFKLFDTRLSRAVSQPEVGFSAWELSLDVVTLCLPLLGTGAVVALVVGGIQTGGVVSLKKLSPDLSRANPFTGLKNLFRLERLISSLRSLLGALLVFWLAAIVVKSEFAALANSVGSVAAASVVGLTLGQNLLWVAALVGLSLAALDLVITRRGWLKRHRMSKDEVRREHRQAEGDPEVKAARQRAHREALSGAALLAVRDATVVIVNPTHLATALRYDEESDEAPLVLSQGMGELAQNIVRAAHAYGVPVVRDVPVAQALQELEAGDEIPEALYEAVAAILRDLFESSTSDKDAPTGSR